MWHVVCPELEPVFRMVRVTSRPCWAGTTFATVAVNGPIPDNATRPATARTSTNSAMPPIAIACTCELDESRSPSGLQRSHRPRSIGIGAPQRWQGWVGSGFAPGAAGVGAAGEDAVRGVVTVRWCHEARLPALHGSDERVDVRGVPGEDDRSVGAGGLPPGPGLAWFADPGRVRHRLVAKPVPLETDQDVLVLAPPPLGLERLEVQRQVRLEVVVEGAPTVADPRRKPRPGPRLTADDDPGWGRRDGVGVGLVQRVERRIARDRATA